MELQEYAKMDMVEKDHWWFRAKRSYLALMLQHFVPQTEASILDVGCGTGAIMDFLEKAGYRVEGIDPSQAALKYCRDKNLKVQIGQADELPFADNTFDAVIALDVLEHVVEDKKSVAEIARVLKPGGIFICTVPAHPWLYSYHDEALHHLRRYAASALRSVLSTDLKLEYLGWVHATILLPAMVLRLARNPKGVAESDIRPSIPAINAIMSLVYRVELLWFSYFPLPWGLSLLAVARK